jgi:hypothetical protein
VHTDVAYPLQHHLVVLKGPGAHPSGKNEEVGFAQFGERLVGRHAEHAVLAAVLAPPGADEDDLNGRDALEHLVGTHRIKCGELLEEGDGCSEGGVHADVLSWATVRKRRR